MSTDKQLNWFTDLWLKWIPVLYKYALSKSRFCKKLERMLNLVQYLFSFAIFTGALEMQIDLHWKSKAKIGLNIFKK